MVRYSFVVISPLLANVYLHYWQKRDLSAKRCVYVWADGIHLQARLEDEKQCILVIIGATPEGKKELLGFTDGARESAHDWRDPLLDLP